jgi:hypothetical protein
MTGNAEPHTWIIVAGSGSNVRDDERVATERLGKLLGREGYGLVAGTWAGVDEIVTRAFLSECPGELQATRIVHISNSSHHSHHELRKGRVIASSPSEAFSPDSVDLAHAGVVVGGRRGSKPTMDALVERGKPVVPFAWLGTDALESLFDLLRDAVHQSSSRAYKKFLYPLIDPVCAIDESVSRILGGITAQKHDIFVSYHRSDAGPEAGRAAHDLMEFYGGRRVFLDHSALPPAARLGSLLDSARKARLVLACIGPSWSKRVTDEQDWVRQELLAALEGGAALVPLVTSGAMPKHADVPSQLHGLLDVNAVFVDPRDWDATLARLVAACDPLLGITRMRPGR